MRIAIWVLGGLVALVAASPSWAACGTKDLAGTFQLYGHGVSLGHEGTTSCRITFDPDGFVVSGTCQSSFGEFWTVEGGSLSVTPDCGVAGEVIISDGITLRTEFLDQANFNLSKDVIIGVGHDDGGDTVFWLLKLKR